MHCAAWKSTDWRGDCRELIRCVDPHSGRRPIYLIDRDQAVGVFDPRDFGVNAVTGIVLSEQFRPMLESRGEWTGHGFVAVVDSERFHENYLRWQGLLLHEYCHDVELRDDAERLVELGSEPSRAKEYEAVTSLEVPHRIASDLRCHGGGFIRISLHVAHRAEQRCGWLGRVWGIVEPEFYGLSDVLEYERAIGDEPQRLEHLPLVEIHKLAPPAAYQRFAAQDLARAEHEMKAPAA